jgi:hypothetical protein
MMLNVFHSAVCLLACINIAASAHPAATHALAVSQALSATLGPYSKAAVFIDTTLADMKLSADLYNSRAAVIVVSGVGRPSRCVADVAAPDCITHLHAARMADGHKYAYAASTAGHNCNVLLHPGLKLLHQRAVQAG